MERFWYLVVPITITILINKKMTIIRIDRTTGRDIDIEGLHIPAGTVVNIPVYALHYDEKVWPEPEKFDPERYMYEPYICGLQMFHIHYN